MLVHPWRIVDNLELFGRTREAPRRRKENAQVHIEEASLDFEKKQHAKEGVLVREEAWGRRHGYMLQREGNRKKK
jgi:hypothetical protein